ncbi:MAG: hypothetical protein KGD64_13545 [Candidatus Heimdallarchaeota archaeon]|nr:hypothetical protein [Candidatus Heimdallarchaeota archaeon]
MNEPWQTISVIAINIVLFYISAAIMSAIMYRNDSKRWTWLNIILAAIISTAWVFGWTAIDGLGSASIIAFGIIIFFLCWIVWVFFGAVGERSAVYTTLGTLILWFLLCWVFLVVMSLVSVTDFSVLDFPTLLDWLP